MLRANPKYVLKNYMLQEAVEAIEKGDKRCFQELKELLISPYDEHARLERYARSTAEEKSNLKLSCSS